MSGGNYLFSAVTSATTDAIRFTSGNTLQFFLGGAGTAQLVSTAVYRDPSAWYHVVVAVDTTQATASNRVRMYVNGVEITSFSTANYPSQNTNCAAFNVSGKLHTIANDAQLANYGDEYLTEVNFVNAQQLTPSSFGTTDAYGIWQPIPYTGTYGTNGFYLKFTDNSALTTSSNVGLGKDFSGNANYWVTNNISITAGSTYDSMIDVPTNTNSNTANYCVLNPLNTGGGTFTDGNLGFTSPATDLKAAQSTIALNTASTGKWYWEVTCVSKTGTNYQVMLTSSSTSYNTNPWLQYRSSDGVVTINGSSAGTFSTFTTGDVIGVTFDASNSQVVLYKNNTLVTTQTISNTSNTYIYAALGSDSSGGTMTYAINFGQRPFSYTPPTGFLPLNTYNLPTPTILQGDDYFNAVLWTGNGASGRSITGVGFAPDWTWIKDRTGTSSHFLLNTISGATKTLFTNNTSAELTESQGLSAFGSDGFTVGNDTGVNESPRTYVAWNWKASNAAGVSNTQGTITSTVSANTTAGFSIVTYSGNGTSGATAGHGLGVKPAMVIIKGRNASTGASEWVTQHQSLSGGVSASSSTFTLSSYTSVVYLSGTYAAGAYGFDAQINGASGTYVAYCFSAVAGYSAFGSYTGNGSTDGSFVFTGFRPRFIMIKRTDSADDWIMMDSSRSTYNVAILTLYANGSFAEDSNVTNRAEDFLSNGFKIRSSGVYLNASSGTYIYMAFAESPFKIARAR